MPLPRREYDRSINAEIERLVYQVTVIRQEAEGLLWGLSDEQFNWSPGPGRWSMAQCFDHLNISNELVIKESEKAIRDGRAAGKMSHGPFAYGFLSRWFYRKLQPPVKSRFKAPKNMEPAPRCSLAEVTERWEAGHERINDLIHDADGLDLAAIKVTSVAASFIRYSLGIGFWIQTAHDRRHLWQSRQVRNHASFPA